jgi:hypothetical protein
MWQEIINHVARDSKSYERKPLEVGNESDNR